MFVCNQQCFSLGRNLTGVKARPCTRMGVRKRRLTTDAALLYLSAHQGGNARTLQASPSRAEQLLPKPFSCLRALYGRVLERWHARVQAPRGGALGACLVCAASRAASRTPCRLYPYVQWLRLHDHSTDPASVPERTYAQEESRSVSVRIVCGSARRPASHCLTDETSSNRRAKAGVHLFICSSCSRPHTSKSH